MKIPTIGDVLEDASGRRYRCAGVTMDDGVSELHPERMTLYVDLDPVKEREPIPEGIRRSLEEER